MAQPSSFSSGLGYPAVWCGVIAGTVASLYLINTFWWLSMPFILAFVICYISKPVLVGLNRRGLSQEQALLSYLVLGCVAILLVILLVLPWLATQLYDLREEIPKFWTSLEAFFSSSASSLEAKFPGFKEAGLSDSVASGLQSFETVLVERWLPDVAYYVVSWIPPLLVVPYLAVFILKDGVKFKRLILRGVPNAYFEKVLLLFHNLDRQVKQYFRGLMAMTFLDTVTLAAGLYLIGLPWGMFGLGQAIFLGLLSAVLAWIPYVGTATACLIIVMVCLAQAPGNLLLVLAAVLLFVVVRLVDDFLYTPMTVGKSLSSHPLLTVMVIFAAGYIGGVLGLLLAMPVLGIWMAMGDVFGQVWYDERLRARYRYTRQLRRSKAQEGLTI
ncbi:MAG: AI-2E family transporter [Gammaproteobacteria bacterium]|nr:AI-2E family transporter [Gammaproteobacteria bacterium]